MDVVRRACRDRGYSEAVASQITLNVRKSTTLVYQAKWFLFCKWCKSRGLRPSRIKPPDLAEFLMFKKEGGLKFPTLMGYKAAIVSTLKFKSKTDFNTEEIKALMKSFQQQDLKTRNVVPAWDLSVVMDTLRKPPFEPLEACNIKLLTYKTIFLVALATGRRVSELHAVQFDTLSWPDNKSYILCRVNPTFIAKNQIALDSQVVQPFKILALTNSLSRGLGQERYLCPVRAVFEYMRKTDRLGLRGDKKQLFISLKPGQNTEIAKITISGWIKKLILFAYEQSQKQLGLGAKIKAHQVRAIALSQAFYNAGSMQDILQAGTWASHNTFTSYYLSDQSHHNGRYYRLGPFIAGQKIIE